LSRKRKRSKREIWDALVTAGAEPRKVDGIWVTWVIADRALVEEFRDALVSERKE
jgi:hypothetical protein